MLYEPKSSNRNPTSVVFNVILIYLSRYVCDDAYSRQEIMAKERDMIETVDYDVGYPLSYRFLRRFGRVKLLNC